MINLMPGQKVLIIKGCPYYDIKKNQKGVIEYIDYVPEYGWRISFVINGKQKVFWSTKKPSERSYLNKGDPTKYIQIKVLNPPN